MVSARGVPGAIGAVVRDANGRRCAITCHHVLYEEDAQDAAPVWAIAESDSNGEAAGRPGFAGGASRRPIALGVTAGGYLGRVTHERRVCFIDCGLVALSPQANEHPAVREALGLAGQIVAARPARTGDRVFKHGPLTGTTRGTVVDVEYYDHPFIAGKRREAPAQLRIAPEDADAYFSTAGESGAAVVDGQGVLLGFLWGCNPAGEGIASPATAALSHLRLSLDVRAP